MTPALERLVEIIRRYQWDSANEKAEARALAMLALAAVAQAGAEPDDGLDDWDRAGFVPRAAHEEVEAAHLEAWRLLTDARAAIRLVPPLMSHDSGTAPNPCRVCEWQKLPAVIAALEEKS